ncbi:hypothetical protein C457_19773 [Haloferax prahovense DSM 18310]|uniref:Uncharacterized protein n=1 Tax=Haloferax prahovense (strain DSM 18310 / JCM 13924 / TL6) TaxID=1227461 RepID=M0FY73_HALPT|nr:hypothetical protein C457_19773 [Haloferax prahovense DSM 18310]
MPLKIVVLKRIDPDLKFFECFRKRISKPKIFSKVETNKKSIGHSSSTGFHTTDISTLLINTSTSDSSSQYLDCALAEEF